MPIDELAWDIRNDRADVAFKRLAQKIARHSAALDKIGEEDVGLITAQMARKFHKSAQELRELNFWLQQIVVELDKTYQP